MKARSMENFVSPQLGLGLCRGGLEEPQKLTQLLAFDGKWCTFWAPLYLNIRNVGLAKPSRSLEEETFNAKWYPFQIS